MSDFDPNQARDDWDGEACDAEFNPARAYGRVAEYLSVVGDGYIEGDESDLDYFHPSYMPLHSRDLNALLIHIDALQRRLDEAGR